ncbi:MAG: alpha/beta hydrolase family protein [Christensenellales bacterium]|jgi:hypothetical protein
MNLPGIFPKSSGFSSADWEEARRPELLRLFEEHVYGFTPTELPETSFETVKSEAAEKFTKHEIFARFSKDGKSCGFTFFYYLPTQAKKPAPAVIALNPFSRSKRYADPDNNNIYLAHELLAENGCAGVLANVDELCADDKDEYANGILKLFPRQGESGWGALGAWAWAGSRIVDFLLSRTEIDSKKMCVLGFSRGGKAALWCGAQDQRIALTISVNSGCSGAAVTRGKRGECIRDITSNFPHWLCEKYSSYSYREEDLPLDQHMLLALCGPRLLYVSSASNDIWADPHKEFESCLNASALYELYGKKGLQQAALPPSNQPLLDGSIGYHLREGDHGCLKYDWQQYIAFINKHLKD